MKKITLFSDGSALGNPGPGGYEGLRALSQKCEVDVISDSSYVVKGINEWLKNWIKKDFKKVKNPDLWREYVKFLKVIR